MHSAENEPQAFGLHKMTENSVITHYKKQLIYRQKDPPEPYENKAGAESVVKRAHSKIYEYIAFVNCDKNNKKSVNNGKTVRRKRKNRNCRGQFRHEAMELIKLGTNPSLSLCKTKEAYSVGNEKPPSEPAPTKGSLHSNAYQLKAERTTREQHNVIQNKCTNKTIRLGSPTTKPPGHVLPQMVPERRNSKELQHPKAPTVIYRSPPHRPQPEYRVPPHPLPHPAYAHPSYPMLQNLPYRHYSGVQTPLLPPPPYPLARSPPRTVPLSPIRPLPQPTYHKTAAAFSGIHVPIPRHLHYQTMVNLQESVGLPPPEYPAARKRKLPEDERERQPKGSPPVVAAIDLTVDQHCESAEKVPGNYRKCHCECGKTYTSDPARQQVITVPSDRNSSQVPSRYIRCRTMSDDQLDCSSNDLSGEERQSSLIQTNAAAKTKTKTEELSKILSKRGPDPADVKVSDNKTSDGKLPPLFLIEDLLAKGVKIEKKSSHNRIQVEERKSNPLPAIPPNLDKSKMEAKMEAKKIIPARPVPIRTEPSRVIVSNKSSDSVDSRRKSNEYNVSSMMAIRTRRQSVDIDTISISSSSSESVRSPRPKSGGAEKQVPQGKLFYYKNNNSFIRYFDDTQKKLFLDNLVADGNGYEIKSASADDSKEIIELPKDTMFSCKDNLTVEEYVSEMNLVEQFVPRDFFLFYKFVTGYQICNNNHPVSFLTFLKIYNTNGLKILLERYVNSLKQN